MQPNDYQTLAARTLISEPETPFTNDELTIMLAALKFGARAGAALDYVKKAICHRHGFDARELHRLLSEMAVADINLRVSAFAPDAHEYHLSGNEQMLIWCALGLGGEAGEVMETIAEIPGEPIIHPAVRQTLIKELGDTDWYNAALCTLIGASMSDVMEQNIAKLKRRYPAGYSSDNSKARVDVQAEKRS